MTVTRSPLASIERTVEIAASADTVFRLLTDPERLVEWWPEAAVFEPRVGGAVRLDFGLGAVVGTVTSFEPPRALGFTWANEGDDGGPTTQVDVIITGLGEGGCRLELVHSGLDAVAAEQLARWRELHEQGWDRFLPRLAALAEARPLP